MIEEIKQKKTELPQMIINTLNEEIMAFDKELEKESFWEVGM